MKALPQAMAGAHFHKRDHGGEVERRDAGGDAQGLAHRIHVDAGACAIAVVALQQVRDSACEFNDFHAALQVSQRIRNGLAVLHRDERGDFLGMDSREFEEAHHHAGPHLRVLRRPLGLRRLGVFDSGAEFRGRRQRHAGLNLAGVGVVDVGKAPGSALHMFAADEMPDVLDHVQFARSR